MSGEIRMDWDRASRTGVAEAVLCAGKSGAQIEAILSEAMEAGRGLLLTRLEEDRFGVLSPSTRARIDYDPVSRTAILPAPESGERLTISVAIVAAGSSDLPVAREAARTLQFHGVEPTGIHDVGVAGLWRLMEALPEIRRHDVVIAVAGMEGALFSVLAGLVRAPVIAVPTSVGYGVGAGGRIALGSALSSCAAGLVTVNIDNGFGAACAALKIAGLMRQGR
ncbi:nickel pincer cofactor biosynthesis protein LarB [Bosea sp. (in: a-proteobacteria)]|uniref:nickel pincer cofactor biosynthesis protein LarB n=1 Tax=Bosea sp. (in: a-proteobacteria) TaxID=1871050 RepID=UPI00262BC03D|nr:nickel pincer cofactor biosynthesis protein LarB [Bosea sp. (in: a-proteobacteria)]MCO5090360.1 nickel pincer cofactor biosynthesis protein LarB [Bosea sp. (in: a-proteobacteria)]